MRLLKRLPYALLALALLLAVFNVAAASRAPLHAPRSTHLVFYLGPEDAVAKALALSDELTRTTDPAQAAVIVVNSIRPASEVAAQIRLRVEAGQMGLVLLMGPELDAAALAELGLAVSNVGRADDPRSLQPQERRVTDSPQAENEKPGFSLLSEIAWNSAPQVRERSVVTGAGIEPLVTLEGSGELFLGVVRNQVSASLSWPTGQGNLVSLPPWTTPPIATTPKCSIG
jgi:hypothetical protein